MYICNFLCPQNCSKYIGYLIILLELEALCNDADILHSIYIQWKKIIVWCT